MLFRSSRELDLTQGGRPIDFDASPGSTRRTIYGFVNRDIVSPLMSTFDVANPNACTAKRPETTVPQQTLFALNSDFIQDRASKIAGLSKRSESISNQDRIGSLFRSILGRPPKAQEVATAIEFLEASTQRQSPTEPSGNPIDPERVWAQLAHAILASNEFAFVD